ncbi:hypothetical protein Tco_0643847, partial [Tanacetum coccineum]
DVNDAVGFKKKEVVVTSDLLALVAEKTKVRKSKEKVVVNSDSDESDDEDIKDMKKITSLLAIVFNRKKYYAKPTNNNLRISLASTFANKKPKYVKQEDKKEYGKKQDMIKVKCYNFNKEGNFAKDCKKAKVKDYNYYKTKMLLVKKDSDEQVLLVKDQVWLELSSDSDQELSANIVFRAKMEKILFYSEESPSFYKETLGESETNYGLFVDYEDDQEFFHDAIELANENFDESLVDKSKEFDVQIEVLKEKNDDLLAHTKTLEEQLKVKHVKINTHTECHVKLEEEKQQYVIKFSSLVDNDRQHR